MVEDAYLHLPGLSVRMRGRRALEVKVYRGSTGLLEVAGRARGRLACRGWMEPGCVVELTEVDAGGRPGGPWGFEATGPGDLLRAKWPPPPPSCSPSRPQAV